jgi:hypothetical protein
MNFSVLKSYKCFNPKYTNMALFLVGILTNGICILIFSLIIIKKMRSNMYKYLLVKSTIDFTITILKLINFIDFPISVYKWCYGYFLLIFLSLSIVFEIAATFDCYISINTKLKCCQTNLFFYLFSFCAVVVYFLVYLIFPFRFVSKKEMATVNNNTITHYSNEISSFGETFYKFHLGFLDSLMRDFILFIIVVILNVMVLVSLIKATRRRRTLIPGSNKILLTSSQRAERRKMLMILTTGINYMLGHLPFFIHYLLEEFFNKYLNCSFIFIVLFFHLSYVDGIVFYFLFNNIFRRILISPFINRN